MRTLLFRSASVRLIGLLFFETALIVGAMYVAAIIRLGDGLSHMTLNIHKALLVAGVTQLWLYFGDLYDFRVIKRPARAVRSLGARARRDVLHARRASTTGSRTSIVGRGVFVLAAFLVITLVSAGGWRSNGRAVASARASGCCSLAPAKAAVGLARELYERSRSRRRDRRLHRSRPARRSARRSSTRASSARSKTFRRSSAHAAWTRSW